MKLQVIHAGNFMLDGGAMFGVVPKSIWQKINPPNELNLCNWAMRCLLIETADRKILVDTGMGNKQDAKFFGHYHLNGGQDLETSLAAAGFTPDDITDVILTHLHFDHCGGAVKKQGDAFLPSFPKATYWSSDRHWKWATEPNEREKASFLKENILPLAEAGCLKLVEAVEEGCIEFDGMEDIKLRFAFGHTDAMMLPQITISGRTIVYMADLLPSAGHIPLPYVMAYDMFPLKTLQEKKAFLAEACEKDYVLFFEHDLVHECCTLQMTEKGVRPREFGRLADFF